ncbi:hypothetical protein LMG24238_04752 [Paraburkholderia sediminicola]|uniref:DUF3443 family protein n=2 Tax=Paraburkholderia sediminicola TaxID=458836 RepID=A0A6J5BZR6_9BURK|nr:hypothetical protein LMG24238_04752 [Paraburkholderia sediminicola]
MPYVSVTLCFPGVQDSTQCATIDHMQLDTGSVGVRVLASALGQALAGRLPAQSGATNDPTGGAPIAECAVFGSGYTWGPIKRADVTIGGKTAGNLPVQVIADDTYSTPSDCVSRGVNNLGTASALGANGVLGIGPAQRDYPAAAQTVLPAAYYYCRSATSCTNTRVPLDTQVMNPVANFTSDNNGTIIRLPALPAGGQLRATGELVFGIGTQSNNAMPSNPNIVALDQNGFFQTTYKSRSYSSAIDSGSNANIFADYTIPSSGDWYTPSTTLSLSAVLTGIDKAAMPVTVPFSLANGSSLVANQYAAYDSLGSPSAGMFVWGLPFFFGRNVYTVLNNVMIGKQVGPFIAF